MITVEAKMTAFNDKLITHNMRPLHANTQVEEGTRQEMVTDVGSTDGLDNENAFPVNGAQNPPDEDPKMGDPGQTPSRNKKMKLDKSAGIQMGTDEELNEISAP